MAVTMPPPKRTRETELAWAAGFFDAEGSTGTTGQPYVRLQFFIRQTDPRVLHRFRSIVQAGRVSGPVPQPDGRKPRWSLYINRRRAVLDTFAALAPYLGPFKRAQAIAAFERSGPGDWLDSEPLRTIQTERAWAAGFFDGEGSTSPRLYKGRPGIALSVGQKDRELLDRFAATVGCGAIYGPHFDRRAEGRFRFDFAASGPTSVRQILGLLCPYLGKVKRRQALEAFDKYRSAFGERGLLDGRPRRCPNGHVYERGSFKIDGRGARQCQECRCARYERFYARKGNRTEMVAA
jgi:hypothetical protein